MTRRRLLVIGLDGATFDLIKPWVAAGDLPNLGRLMRDGAHAPLRSTLPAMTFPAWSSMMTGVNPGRHGIFDFTRRVSGGYAVEFVNATHRRFPTIWRLLSDAGYRVGVVGVPTTYPPEPVNGVMIAGFDAPVTTGIDASFVYPPQLYDELRRNVGEYRITDFQELHIDPGWHARALAGLRETLRVRTDIAEYLLKREAWDCFMVLFGESDTVGHHFWMFHDDGSPRHDAVRARSEGLGDAIRTIYRDLDEMVGRLTAAAPDATVVVLSDHGFGGTGDKILYLNRWLAEEGFLQFTPNTGLSAQAIGVAKQMALRILPSWVQEQVFRRGGGWLANRVESQTRFAGIDWAHTLAFSEESNTCPAIWLNVLGREAGGIVSAPMYEALRDDLIERIEAWRLDDGSPIVAKAWRREDLYQGPYVNRAPDIVLQLALDHGYAFTCQGSRGKPGPALRRLEKTEHVGAKGQSMNGSHRADGVLILAGEGVRPAVHIDNPSLIDIAPTLLSLLDVDVTYEVDGRVLTEAILPTATDGIDRVIAAPELADTLGYDAEQSALIEARLRNLGYLE